MSLLRLIPALAVLLGVLLLPVHATHAATPLHYVVEVVTPFCEGSPCPASHAYLHKLQPHNPGADARLGEIIGPDGKDRLIIALARAPGGALYGTDGLALYRIQIAPCCKAVALGPFNTKQTPMVALAFTPNGTLYGGTLHGNLVLINLRTTRATVVHKYFGGLRFSGGMTAPSSTRLVLTEFHGFASCSRVGGVSCNTPNSPTDSLDAVPLSANHTLETLLPNFGYHGVVGLFNGSGGYFGVTVGQRPANQVCGYNSALIHLATNPARITRVRCLPYRASAAS